MKIRRLRKYLHFVFQLFIFPAGLLGFWQRCVHWKWQCFQRMKLFYWALQDTTAVWVLGKLCCIPAGRGEQSFYRGHVEIQDRLYSPKGGFCTDGHICSKLPRYRKSGSGGYSQESWWLPSRGPWHQKLFLYKDLSSKYCDLHWCDYELVFLSDCSCVSCTGWLHCNCSNNGHYC